MAQLIDYMTNLDVKDDPARALAYAKMIREFKYLPVYGPNILDVQTGQKLFAWIIQEFPGFKWVVEVRDTIVTVVNESLGANWGFRIREGKLDNDGKIIRLMAGELLERHGVAREGINEETLAELPRDLRGNVKRV